MERESFEDEEVAALLNRDFVAIKVDREERPDIDHLYMAVCQALTGQGGWPLTIVMTPDRKPFFAGTYFPKRRKYGRIGLMELLQTIAEKWKEDPQALAENGEYIVSETAKRMHRHSEGELSSETARDAYQGFRSSFDPVYGGFGPAPKFPAPHNLMFLLRYYHKTGEAQALHMVERTLEFMHRGGMYDHIGFGFARYSTDRQWLVPHFEKMLYDNALLAMAYIEAFQVTGKGKYGDIARQIFTYVLRDMTDPEGGFYSAEDADSEGEEGKFYIWRPEEVREVLGEEEAKLFCDVYDITEEGNFEGHSIPNLLDQLPEEYARWKGMPETEVIRRLESARARLFEHRDKRVHPHKDDKILTSWNGLMIAALAKGARALGEIRYAEAASKAVRFIFSRLRREDGRLLARYRGGEAAYPAYVDDYAFLVWGLLELYEATYDASYMEQAVELTGQMLDLFWDSENGGLFYYGHDSEQLLVRMKEIYDGAVPSGNAVAAYNLLRLARYTGRGEWWDKAGRLMRAFGGSVQQYPMGHAMMLTALLFAEGPNREIVVAGRRERQDTQQLLQAIRKKFMPNAITALYEGDGAGDQAVRLMPFLEGKTASDGQPLVYLCENYACQAPVSSLAELEAKL